MGIYSRLMFPRLCDWAMGIPTWLTSARRLSEVDGEIWRLGSGQGSTSGMIPNTSVTSLRWIRGSA